MAGMLMLSLLSCCTSGFDQKKADEILAKDNISQEEYSILLQIYEEGMDDAIQFSQKKPEELSPDEQKEVMTVFAIGMRLSRDEDRLDESETKLFEEINRKGTEELKK